MMKMVVMMIAEGEGPSWLTRALVDRLDVAGHACMHASTQGDQRTAQANHLAFVTKHAAGFLVLSFKSLLSLRVDCKCMWISTFLQPEGPAGCSAGSACMSACVAVAAALASVGCRWGTSGTGCTSA